MAESNKEKQTKTAVQELVYHEIRQNLMVGTFVPGQRVSLRFLAEQMGTSLTPVRGAVNRLIAEGAFKILPNRTIIIPSMTEKKFSEIVHWRVQLESEAVKMASKSISKKALKSIDQINNKMIRMTEKNSDRKDLLVHNYNFHFAIYRESQSEVLPPMIESLWLQCGPFTYYSLLSPRELWDARYHLEIIQALREGNTKAAVQALKNDILSTARFLKENGHYEQQKLRRILT